jgi:phenylacetate-CoA ligase
MTDDRDTIDPLALRDPARREAALMAALPAQVRAAQAVPALARRLTGVDAAAVTTREALARLPVTRKHELLAGQQAGREAGREAVGEVVQEAAAAPDPAAPPAPHDPFGGFSAIGWRATGALRRARRVLQSPGPIYEPEPDAADPWRSARALQAAGFRAGDLLHNAFSYHLTPGAWIIEGGALALGCTVFPAGTGQTEQQLQAMQHLRPDGYAGTPSFLRILLEKAAEQGIALPSLKKALVSGEAFPPSLRDWLAARGVDGYQAYATADVGMIAYETAARQGLVVDEGVLVEIVRPGTGDPVPDGDVGEVVVTVFGADYPLLRFGTGDLSAILPGPCPTGRTNRRIRGWLGRADQTTKVRGMFVHPGDVAAVLKRHPQVLRGRLVVSGSMAQDELLLRVECRERAGGVENPEGLAQALQASVREQTRLRAEVELLAPGTLPNDGKVIEDARRYD